MHKRFYLAKEQELTAASAENPHLILPHLPLREIPWENNDQVGLSLQLVEKLFPSWSIVLFNEQRRIQFISNKEVYFFDDHPAELKMRSCVDFFTYVHPEDRDATIRIFRRAKDLVYQLLPEEVDDYRFVLNYRYLGKDGRFRLMHEETLYMLNTQRQYNIFTIVKDITDEKFFTRVFLEWYKTVNGSNRRMGTYVPAMEDAGITPRETEILQLN